EQVEVGAVDDGDLHVLPLWINAKNESKNKASYVQGHTFSIPIFPHGMQKEYQEASLLRS
ncbi:MAG TPA: hypothetical protein VMZ03_14290, partial [Chitinophagaceae bacterium]|nr:hypothetical protein [Chitinophagaceae bacterium]